MCLHTSLWCYCLKELTLILLVGALILSKFLLLLKPPRIIPISSAVVYTHWGCRFPLPCWLESWFLTACLLHFSQKNMSFFLVPTFVWKQLSKILTSTLNPSFKLVFVSVIEITCQWLASWCDHCLLHWLQLSYCYFSVSPPSVLSTCCLSFQT